MTQRGSFIVPDPDEVLGEIRPLTDELWPALESANASAIAFFDRERAGEERRWDANVHASLTRYFAIQLLDRAGVDAQAESGDLTFERIGLANNGICLMRGRHVIRVRKADDGRLPAPGSLAQEEFYAQQMSLPFNIIGIESPDDPANFVILWGISAVDHAMNDLVLACPSATKEPYWYAKVVHPALKLRRADVIVRASQDDFDEIVPAAADIVRDQE
jgi:hypothetical protein